VTLTRSCHFSATCPPDDTAKFVLSLLDPFAYEVGLAAMLENGSADAVT
jgi:hypothetical protein